MIDVTRDTDGLRMAIAEIFERDFQTAFIGRSLENANAETRDRLLAAVPPLTLSPGYARLAGHLMQLEREQRAGIPYGVLARWEADGLVALHETRIAHEVKHPACGVCGTRQQTRFGVECPQCGAKFRRKK